MKIPALFSIKFPKFTKTPKPKIASFVSRWMSEDLCIGGRSDFAYREIPKLTLPAGYRLPSVADWVSSLYGIADSSYQQQSYLNNHFIGYGELSDLSFLSPELQLCLLAQQRIHYYIQDDIFAELGIWENGYIVQKFARDFSLGIEAYYDTISYRVRLIKEET